MPPANRTSTSNAHNGPVTERSQQGVDPATSGTVHDTATTDEVVVQRLKLLQCLHAGDRINTSVTPIPARQPAGVSLLQPMVRYWVGETRHRTLAFVRISLCDGLALLRRQCKAAERADVLCDLQSARAGCANLLFTYRADDAYVSALRQVLDAVDRELQEVRQLVCTDSSGADTVPPH